MPSPRLLAAVFAMLVGLWPQPAHPSDGHHCIRIDDGCWQCVDLTFPVKVPCSQTDACGPCEVCADRGGQTSCLQPRVVCCANPPCRAPPGCARAARSCRDIGADGMLDACVMTERCLPRGNDTSVAPVCQSRFSSAASPAAKLTTARRASALEEAPKPRAEARAELFWRTFLKAPLRWFGIAEPVAEPSPARAHHAPPAGSAESS